MGGSTLRFDNLESAQVASVAAVNSTLAASGGGLFAFLFRLRHSTYDLAKTCNGILAGLVACSAGCVDMHLSVAIATGVLGGLAMEGGHALVQYFHIDDPLDAFAVHACAGATGVLTRPLFDKTGVDAKMFGAHCLAVLCISLWSGGWTCIVFGFMKLINKFRIPDIVEEKGGNLQLAQPEVYRISEGTQAVSRCNTAASTPAHSPVHSPAPHIYLGKAPAV